MQRVSRIVGKPVVSAATGENVGTIDDVLIDAHVTRVRGFVIRGGLFRSEHVLLFDDVQTLGTDAVIARSADGVLGPREWRQKDPDASRSSGLQNRRVVTAAGRQLGVVRDVYFEDQTGTVAAYEIASPAFGGLSERRSMLPLTGGVAVGPDAIVVPEEPGLAGASSDGVRAVTD